MGSRWGLTPRRTRESDVYPHCPARTKLDLPTPVRFELVCVAVTSGATWALFNGTPPTTTTIASHRSGMAVTVSVPNPVRHSIRR